MNGDGDVEVDATVDAQIGMAAGKDIDDVEDQGELDGSLIDVEAFEAEHLPTTTTTTTLT